VCINTGGEKVFPEEVEEVLKLHPAVRDAVCVGLPDDRFGQRICAVVEPEPGAEIPELDALADHTKTRLAGYKAPRELVIVDTIGRAPSGKVDYKALTALAAGRLGPAGERR
jgi:fatty-acyl-CoA synthase